MPYYLLKFDRNGRGSVVTEKVMIETTCVSAATEQAEVAANRAGGGKAILKLFNEVGLVATRSGQGVWSASRK